MKWIDILADFTRGPQFLKFCIVGLSNTLLSFLVFWTLVQANLHVFWAQTISYCAGIFWSFFVNSRWTFETNDFAPARFARFLVLQISLMLVSAFSISTLTYATGIGANTSWIAIMAIVTIANFWLSRSYVFNEDLSSDHVISGQFILVVSAILATAVFKGVSFGDSNHGTYLPAGIRLVDTTFLANDWWMQNALHYHFAFKYLVAGLYALDVLKWGVALLNIACVAGAVAAVYSLARKAKLDLTLPSFLVLLGIISATDGLTSVADTYLFSPSLQPSTIGTVGLLWAVSQFVSARYGLTGLILALSGLFHANFLLINIPLFGLMFAVQHLANHGFSKVTWQNVFSPLLLLLAPSVLVFLATLPFLGAVAFPDVAPADQQTASRLFREFAVPHHYKPITYLNQFWALAGWQLIGLAWTSRATSAQKPKYALYAIQISFAAVLWVATSLTTIIDIDFIARLFFWRLAPFSVLIALLIFLAGCLKELLNPASATGLQRLKLIGFSLLALIAVLRTNSYYYGFEDISNNFALIVATLMLGLVAIRWVAADPASHKNTNAPASWLTLPAVTVMTLGMIIGFNPINYKLLYMEGKYLAQFDAYKWIELNTPPKALFLIPPEMGDFRLQTKRSTVVDLIALPFGAKNLIDWYSRLEDVSQTSAPQNKKNVIAGYRSLTLEQFAKLQTEYGADFALLHRSSWNEGMAAQTIYQNDRFVVLSFGNSSAAGN